MPMSDPRTAWPVQMMQLYGFMAERQLRLVVELNRAMWCPNPFLAAYMGVTWPPKPPREAARPAPKPRPVPKRPVVRANVVALTPPATAKGKRARRQPSPPPPMPGTAE
ncbi:hypothetical protein [Pseudooceanicola sp. LIPI14-2-Ac024]|uniref:hypothetical protein n=1 Tax=Pseudooceanicola sp. LIPI14-2-Ac024 TaxID=3344875 RepID=UPI0035D08F4C